MPGEGTTAMVVVGGGREGEVEVFIWSAHYCQSGVGEITNQASTFLIPAKQIRHHLQSSQFSRIERESRAFRRNLTPTQAFLTH